MASDRLRLVYRKIYDLSNIISDDTSSIDAKILAFNQRSEYIKEMKQLEEIESD